MTESQFTDLARAIADQVASRSLGRLGHRRYLRSGADSKLISLRVTKSKSTDRDEAAVISYEMLARKLDALQKNATKAIARDAIEELAFVFWAAHGATKNQESAAKAVRAILRPIETRAVLLRNFLERNKSKAQQSFSKLDATSLSVDYADFQRLLQSINLLIQPAIDHLLPSAVVEVPDVADAMRLLGEKVATNEGIRPEYVRGGEDKKLVNVSIEGFRGAASKINVDFRKNGKPVSVLLWGDNGVGKSTIVDGIEFALQGRVDRSADFESASRARLPNLTAERTTASVELSDGTIVYRDLRAAVNGDEGVTIPVGFRVAPIVLRRSDIVRFQESQTLSRGSIFFDYFPADENRATMRPDDRIRMLEEKDFALRLERDLVAHRLSGPTKKSVDDLVSPARFEQWFEDKYGAAVRLDTSSQFRLFEDSVREDLARLRAIQLRIRDLKSDIDKGVDNLNPVAYRHQRARLQAVLGTVSDNLTESFLRITRAPHIRALRVVIGVSGPISLDTVIEFQSGQSALPSQAFSEGYRDLISLLLFVEMTAEAAELGQARILVLDDVVQSVDSAIRLEFFNFLINRLPDWQLIIVGHDRAWLEQLRALLAGRGRAFMEITVQGWSFAEGLQFKSGASVDHGSSLRAALAGFDSQSTASAAGLLLEQIAGELSWRVQASVIRRQGDRYTLSDTWSGVAKRLKATALKGLVLSIDTRVSLRNQLGAHFNDWALGIAFQDARNFGEDVLRLYESVFCAQCVSWVGGGRGEVLSCGCGTLTVS